MCTEKKTNEPLSEYLLVMDNLHPFGIDISESLSRLVAAICLK
jgi:hypothetical protein